MLFVDLFNWLFVELVICLIGDLVNWLFVEFLVYSAENLRYFWEIYLI